MAYTKHTWVDGTEDDPGKGTTIKATWMNEIEDELEALENDKADQTALAQLKDSLMYKSGDSFSLTSKYTGTYPLICPAYLTSGAEEIRFTIYLPKSTTNISNANLQLYGGIRHADGGYIASEGSDLSSLGTINYLLGENFLNVTIILDTRSSFTNNSICAVSLQSGTEITFS